jgi:hypothetical protein
VPLTRLILEIFNLFLEKPHRFDHRLTPDLTTARPGYKVNLRVKSKFMTGRNLAYYPMKAKNKVDKLIHPL